MSLVTPVPTAVDFEDPIKLLVIRIEQIEQN